MLAPPTFQGYADLGVGVDCTNMPAGVENCQRKLSDYDIEEDKSKVICW